jgi:hypothetical protein
MTNPEQGGRAARGADVPQCFALDRTGVTNLMLGSPVDDESELPTREVIYYDEPAEDAPILALTGMRPDCYILELVAPEPTTRPDPVSEQLDAVASSYLEATVDELLTDIQQSDEQPSPEDPSSS